MTGLCLSVSSTLDAQVTMAYDAVGNLTGLSRTAGGGLQSMGYDTIASSLSYNAANELTNITHMDTTSGTTLASYTYGYNAAGELTNYQDNSGNSLTYGYDPSGQLTSATGSLAGANYTFTYNYDANGNRTSTSTNVGGNVTSATYTTGTGNELLSDGTYNYTYDKNGNTLTQTDIATGTVTYYSWDYENRLTQVKVVASNGTVLNDETFTYDVFGNCIGLSLNGTQTLYTVYDGSNPYMDFNGSGTLTERYLTNPNALSQFYGQVNASGTTQWFLTDNLKSIRQVVNTTGTALDVITYDPFGKIISQTNAANAPRMGFAGGVVDSLTGNVQFDARPYNPADGRWLEQDPLGFAGGDANLYRYVFNNATDTTDTTGEFDPVTWGFIILGIIIVGGISGCSGPEAVRDLEPGPGEREPSRGITPPNPTLGKSPPLVELGDKGLEYTIITDPISVKLKIRGVADVTIGDSRREKVKVDYGWGVGVEWFFPPLRRANFGPGNAGLPPNTTIKSIFDKLSEQ